MEVSQFILLVGIIILDFIGFLGSRWLLLFFSNYIIGWKPTGVNFTARRLARIWIFYLKGKNIHIPVFNSTSNLANWASNIEKIHPNLLYCKQNYNNDTLSQQRALSAYIGYINKVVKVKGLICCTGI